MIILYFSIPLIFVIVLLSPIRIKITRNDHKNDIDLYLVKIFNTRVDIDQTIANLYSKNDKMKPSTATSLYNILRVYKTRSFVKSVFKMSKVKKVTVIIRNNTDDEVINSLFNVTGWLMVSFLRKIILENFKTVKDEYYMVDNYSKSTKVLNLELDLEIRLIYFIYSLLINLKEFPKIIKLFKKGSESDEQSSDFRIT